LSQEIQVAKRGKKLRQADAFRARVQQLRALSDADWNDWEADWLDKEAARYDDYIYTDKERVILNQLVASATVFEGYNGCSVPELLEIVYRHRADLDDDSEAFIERHYRRGPRTLRVRQINRLAAICRLTDDIGRDEEVDRVLREVRGKDEDLHELPDFVPYGQGGFSITPPWA
jgi:hypothetical protein